jgi:VWFA-related protein
MSTVAWAPAVLMSLLLPGQVPPRPPTFAAKAEVVRLDVLALHQEQPIRDLTENDFEVRDNGVRQKVHVVRALSLRWEVVVLFDVSESVKGPKLEAFRACARAIAAALREGDQAALVTFSDVVELRSAMSAPAGPFLNALDGVRAGGSTALFDALFSALALSGPGPARPLVLLFTDGRDNVSWLSADDVVGAARLSDASIYAVSTSSIGGGRRWPADRPTWASVAVAPDDKFLRKITRETGGRLLHAESIAGLQARLAAVLDEIGDRYIVTYEPVGVAQEGWHEIHVRMRRRAGAVVVRPGYFRPRAAAGNP